MQPDEPPPTAETGQDCPRSGVWQACGVALPPLLIARGAIMPAAGGRVVTWVLITADPPGQG